MVIVTLMTILRLNWLEMCYLDSKGKIAMRNADRIAPFMNSLATLWAENPDLRFGQLVTMVQCYFPKGTNYFNAEEPAWEKAIQVALEQGRQL